MHKFSLEKVGSVVLGDALPRASAAQWQGNSGMYVCGI